MRWVLFGTNSHVLERALFIKLTLKGRFLRDAKHVGTYCCGRWSSNFEIRTRVKATQNAWFSMGSFGYSRISPPRTNQCLPLPYLWDRCLRLDLDGAIKK